MTSRTVFLSLLAAASLSTAPRPITVWIAGDSTAAEKLASKRPETGWGEMLGQYFRPAEVRVANRALNGRSTKSFVSEGHWRAITDSIQAGDYVFIQFGHNDEPGKASYSPPDVFKKNLSQMIDEVQARGGLPVLMTPVVRRRFDANGRLENTHGEYPELTRAVATERKVPLIDMERGSAAVLQSFGADSSAKLFLQLAPGENPNYPEGVKDNTHFRPLGAELMARIAVDGITALKLELAAHLHSR
ncbi:MAG: rhamnogalacturonan acetylesterase [Gemmatimonadota bacterium]